MLTQSSAHAWKPLCEPVWLCNLPVHPSAIEERFGFQFERDVEDGIGSGRYAVGLLIDKLVLLKACHDGSDEAQRVAVWILGQETAWDEILANLRVAFGCTVQDLALLPSALRPGRWALWRLDDNGNEVEMFRFPDQGRAEQAKETFEKRGHKQAYFIRRAVSPGAPG